MKFYVHLWWPWNKHTYMYVSGIWTCDLFFDLVVNFSYARLFHFPLCLSSCLSVCLSISFFFLSLLFYFSIALYWFLCLSILFSVNTKEEFLKRISLICAYMFSLNIHIYPCINVNISRILKFLNYACRRIYRETDTFKPIYWLNLRGREKRDR